MPIAGINQPETLQVDKTIRLRKFDGNYDFAHAWYQDVEAMYMMDGEREPYPLERVARMYQYLDQHGELYFIEVLKADGYHPIGDVTFWQEDMPIIIGDPSYRGQKIGQTVVAALVERGRSLGYETLYVAEIYDHNIASRRCFETVGFRACKKTEKGNRYKLTLEE